MAGWVLAFLQGVCGHLDESHLCPLSWPEGQQLGKTTAWYPSCGSWSSHCNPWLPKPHPKAARLLGDPTARRFDRAASSIAWMWWILSIMADGTGTQWWMLRNWTLMEKSWEIPVSNGNSFTSEIKWVIANWWIRPVPLLFIQSGLSPAHLWTGALSVASRVLQPSLHVWAPPEWIK